MSQQLGTLRQEAPAPCHLLAWDTEFWGRPIARVDASSVTPDSVRAIDEWCLAHGVGCAKTGEGEGNESRSSSHEPGPLEGGGTTSGVDRPA